MALLITSLLRNPYSLFFKRLQSWDDLQDAHIVIRSYSQLDKRTYNLPTVDKVAAVWKSSNGNSENCERDIQVYTVQGHGRKVYYHYSCYDPLQYPLLFPYGESGWHVGRYIKKRALSRSRHKPLTKVSSAEAILAMEEEVCLINKNSRINVSLKRVLMLQNTKSGS